jgi:hypothetical protein
MAGSLSNYVKGKDITKSSREFPSKFCYSKIAL